MELTDFDFMVAFKVYDYNTKANKDDPNIVQWVAVIEDYDLDDTWKKTYVKTHKCTEADKDKFYDPATESKAIFAEFKNENSFFCLNQTDLNGKTALYGNHNGVMAHRRLDIMYMPCGSPQTYESGCKNNNTTLEETQKYL
jgi:hypothetical protein